MSFSSSPALVLDVSPQRGVRRGLVLLALLIAMLMLADVLHGGWVGAFILVVLVMAGLMLIQHQSSSRPQRLIWLQQGQWQLQFAGGRVQDARLLPTSWLTPWAWCLRFEASDAMLPAVLVWRPQLTTQAWQLWRTRLYLEGRAPKPLTPDGR